MTETRNRFMRQVIVDHRDCWLWTGAKATGGYGGFYLDGRNQRAHRVAWKLFRGPIPDSMFVCHKCDVTACVNPAHLWLGTHHDNMIDSGRKGRNASQRYPMCGSKHGNSKLTEDAVRQIRSMPKPHKIKDIAAQFNVHPSTIERVLYGWGWKHV